VALATPTSPNAPVWPFYYGRVFSAGTPGHLYTVAIPLKGVVGVVGVTSACGPALTCGPPTAHLLHLRPGDGHLSKPPFHPTRIAAALARAQTSPTIQQREEFPAQRYSMPHLCVHLDKSGWGVNHNFQSGRRTSALVRIPDSPRISRHFRGVPILLQKYFWGDERKSLRPPMRFTRGDVRDHIVSSKINHGPPKWR
jgi:hypothetical protein